MLASQIIYTACGKTKKGDFETWSKSVDITQVEEDEICTKMSYKRLTEHDPFPTQKEIDEIFPKKFSYFKLSSGRYCIAMSTYVGKVYSDEDNRSGNYVMHGYVFEKPASFVPADFFGNSLFKQSLSREEWFDIGAPASLPQVDFPDSVYGLSDDDLREFFTPARLEKLKLLVQAVYNAQSNDEKITFHDDYANIPYWYKGLSICFDEVTQSELTFCTFFTPGYTNTTANPNAADTDVKIRNVHPSRPGSPQFIYQNEAADGRYAFDFAAGYYPNNITVSNFVNAVVDGIVEDTDTVKTVVSEIGAICQKCGIDPDTALNVSYLLRGDVGYFDGDLALLESVVHILERCYPESISDTADAIYNYAIRDGKWLLSPRINFFFDFITENASVVNQPDMVTLYLENLSAFGVTNSGNALDFCESVKQNAPFKRWEYVEMYLLDDELLETYNNISSITNHKSFFVYHTYANTLPKVKGNADYKKKVAVYVAREMRRAIRDAYESSDLSEVKSLCDVIAKVEASWPYNAVNSALTKFKNSDGSTQFDSFDKVFVLTLAEMLDADFRCREGAVALIIECARSSVNSPDYFLPKFIKHEENHKALYSTVINALGGDDSMQVFLRDLRFARFAQNPNPSEQELNYYFRNRFVNGEDDYNLFCDKMLKKLKNSGDVITECFSCMKNYIIPVKGTLDEVNEERLENLANKMRELIFAQGAEKIKDYIEKHSLKSFDDLDAICTDNFIKPAVYDVMCFYVNTIRALGSAPIPTPATNYRTAPSFNSDPQEQENASPIDIYDMKKKELLPCDGTKSEDEEKTISGYIVKWYMGELMNIYLRFENPEKFAEIFQKIFSGYRLSSMETYQDAYVAALNAFADTNEYKYIAMLHATIVFRCINAAKENPSEKVEKLYAPILEKAFAAIPKKNTKTVITKLLEVGGRNPKWSVKQYDRLVAAYLNEYQEKVKGNSFFGKLAAKFIKKRESDDKKAQKANEKNAKKGAPAPMDQPEQAAQYSPLDQHTQAVYPDQMSQPAQPEQMTQPESDDKE